MSGVDDRQATARRTASRVLFFAVALGTTSFVAAVTVSTIVGEDMTNSASLSGLPWAAGVLGTGIGSLALSQLMARRGRGPGLLLGFLSGAVGAVLAIAAIRAESFLLFVPATLVLGVGNSASHLSRYAAAADLYPPPRSRGAVVPARLGLEPLVRVRKCVADRGPCLLGPCATAGSDRQHRVDGRRDRGTRSGVLVEAFSYGLLCVVGALLVIAPVFVIASRRRALAVQPA